MPRSLRLTVRAGCVPHRSTPARRGDRRATKLPVVLGHQIVGDARRTAASRRSLARMDLTASVATAAPGRENLCERARFTGRDIDGGFAEYTVADERFCFELPDGYQRRAGRAAAVRRADRLPRAAARRRRRTLGLYGFGSAAHIICQVAAPRAAGVRVHARRATGDPGVRALARRRVGRRHDERPPEQLDGAMIFAPAGELVPAALRRRTRRHRRLRGNPHERHPGVPLRDLWHERMIRSVANLTREDARVPGAGATPVETTSRLPARAGRAGTGGPARRALRGHRGRRAVAHSPLGACH